MVANKIANIVFLLFLFFCPFYFHVLDSDGESALFQAASAGNVEIVEILIGSGVLVDSENKVKK